MVDLVKNPFKINNDDGLDVLEIDPLVGGDVGGNKSKIEKKESRTLENWLEMEPVGNDYAGNEDAFFDALGSDV